jgi:hypothetical protein
MHFAYFQLWWVFQDIGSKKIQEHLYTWKVFNLKTRTLLTLLNLLGIYSTSWITFGRAFHRGTDDSVGPWHSGFSESAFCFQSMHQIHVLLKLPLNGWLTDNITFNITDLMFLLYLIWGKVWEIMTSHVKGNVFWRCYIYLICPQGIKLFKINNKESIPRGIESKTTRNEKKKKETLGLWEPK